MLGLALEGGGAKGAFHIGAVEACMEMGLWPPAAVAGTSIGAMNAAMIAQGDFDKCRTLWEKIDGKGVFSPEDEKLIYANFKELDLSGLADLLSAFKSLVADGGVDNTNMRAIIDENIDPQRLMDSPMDFGLVTVSLPDFRAVEIFKDEMGVENIPLYILASAAFPGFKRVKMGKRTFVDGGVYDNCPVNMLLERGCDRVIAVRTNAVGITRYDDKDERVITIRPSDDLGSLMKFSPDMAQRNIKLGYYDGLRALMKLRGRRYYLTDTTLNLAGRLYSLDDEIILRLASLLKLGSKVNPKRLLFERVLPVMFDEMELSRYDDYDALILALVENRAERCGVERLCLYTATELLEIGLSLKPLGRQKNVGKAVDLMLESLSK